MAESRSPYSEYLLRSLRVNLLTPFRMSIVVALTGVAIFQARAPIEMQVELGVCLTVVYADTIRSSFINKLAYH
jgi:hypothetical protein